MYLKLFVIMGVNWIAEIVSGFFPEYSYIWIIPDLGNSLQVNKRYANPLYRIDHMYVGLKIDELFDDTFLTGVPSPPQERQQLTGVYG